MPSVAGILLESGRNEPAQAGLAAVEPGHVDELVEPAAGQGGGERGAGAFDGAIPERVELLRVSRAAEVNSQLLLPSQPVVSHGAPIGSPRSLVVNM